MQVDGETKRIWKHLAVRRERYGEEGFRLGLVAKAYQDAADAVFQEDPVQVMRYWGDICARNWEEAQNLTASERAAKIGGIFYAPTNIVDIRIHQGMLR